MSPTTPSSAPELVGIAVMRGAIAGLVVGTTPVLLGIVMRGIDKEPSEPSAGIAMFLYAGVGYGTLIGMLVGCVVGLAVSVVRRRVRRLWIASAVVTFVLFVIPSMWWLRHARSANLRWALSIPITLAIVAAVAACGVHGDVRPKANRPRAG